MPKNTAGLKSVRTSEEGRELGLRSGEARRARANERLAREARKAYLASEQLSLGEASTLVVSAALDGILAGEFPITSAREAAQVATACYAIGRAEEAREREQPQTREELIATIRQIRDLHAVETPPTPS